MFNILLLLITILVLLLTRLWFILPNRNGVVPKKKPGKICRTCIFLGSGGHTAEMLQLVKSLDPKRYTPRIYMVANTDLLSKEKAIEYEQGSFEVYSIPRAREMHQPLYTVPWTFFIALIASLKVMIKTRPDLILCNGPGSCIPVCMLAYIPRLLGIKKVEIIYIESFARVDTLSLTGRLLYPFVDRFLVQWPELSNILDKAEYKGLLV